MKYYQCTYKFPDGARCQRPAYPGRVNCARHASAGNSLAQQRMMRGKESSMAVVKDITPAVEVPAIRMAQVAHGPQGARYKTVEVSLTLGTRASGYLLVPAPDMGVNARAFRHIYGPKAPVHAWDFVWAVLDIYENRHGEVTFEQVGASTSPDQQA